MNGGSGGRGFISVLCFELGFEFSDALVQGRDGDFHFRGSETRSDVFRAVPVERDAVDKKQPLDNASLFGFGELRDKFENRRALR